MTRLRILINAILIFNACYLSAQLTLEKDFAVSKPPVIASKNWFMLNHAGKNHFETVIVNGTLRINRTNYIDSIEFQLPKGRLVGIDHGEWGGSLRFIPHDAGTPLIPITSGNIRFIFSFAGSIYYIDALAHLGINEGKMFRLDTAGLQSQPVMVMEFDSAPEAITVYDNKLLIATHGSFFVVDEQMQKRKIFDEAFWASLYPTSVAVRDMGHVYMGVRGGIVEFNLETRTFIFHLYKNIHFGTGKDDYDTPTYMLNK